MSFSDQDLKNLFDIAIAAAARAGVQIENAVGKHYEVQTKRSGGDSPAAQVVTEVDFESQQLILDILTDSVFEYELGTLTEESLDDSSRLERDAFWCIDPLDGTLPFVEGKPGYSVSIALVSRSGLPLLGVVRDPAKNQTFHAVKGQGAYLNGERISTNPSVPDQPKLTWLMDRSMKQLEDFPQISEEMEALAADFGCADGLRVIDHAGAALNGCWVTQHSPAVYFKLPKTGRGGGSVWDFAASACVIQECGMVATDIFGDALDLNPDGSTFMNQRGVLYASSLDLADALRSTQFICTLGA